MEDDGPRLLRLEEDAGPVRPSKNPVDLVSECIMRKGGWGWEGEGECVWGPRGGGSEGEVCHLCSLSLY